MECEAGFNWLRTRELEWTGYGRYGGSTSAVAFRCPGDARSKLRMGMSGRLTEASLRPDPEGRGGACVGATNPAERTSDQATGMIMRSAATSTIR